MGLASVPGASGSIKDVFGAELLVTTSEEKPPKDEAEASHGHSGLVGAWCPLLSISCSLWASIAGGALRPSAHTQLGGAAVAAPL